MNREAMAWMLAAQEMAREIHRLSQGSMDPYSLAKLWHDRKLAELPPAPEKINLLMGPPQILEMPKIQPRPEDL